MAPSNNVLNQALQYHKSGFSVIPVNPSQQQDKRKKPFVKWIPFQKRQPDPGEIRQWWAKWPSAMVGIVTGKGSGLLVIDCDTPEGEQAIEELLPDSLNIPTVRTPRGGKHLYFRMPDENIRDIVGLLPGVDVRAEGGYIIAPPSVNGEGKRYQWTDGLSIDEVTPPQAPSALIALIKDFAFKGGKGGCNVGDGDITNHYKPLQDITYSFKEGRRDETLFHIANCLFKGGCEEPLTSKVLSMLALQCEPPFPEKEIAAKIQSAMQRSRRRDRNLAEEIKNWVAITSGYFFITDCFKSLHIITSAEVNAGRVAFHRLHTGKNPLIERHGDKDGCYRRVDGLCEDIDFLNVSGNALDIRFPFELETHVKILPKNIIVIAGEQNAGKTAFMLNVAEMNMNKHEVVYLSSEMGALELQDRLNQFDRSLESWKVNFKERSSNFADVIRPNVINIIDFLEIHDEFFKVGQHIKDIFDKLDKGIAIIAIQKNKGNEYGLGGGRSLEKARLYLSMEPGKIKIVKAKNWTNSANNPNGLELTFKLIKGCHFAEEGRWKKG